MTAPKKTMSKGFQHPGHGSQRRTVHFLFIEVGELGQHGIERAGLLTALIICTTNGGHETGFHERVARSLPPKMRARTNMMPSCTTMFPAVLATNLHGARMGTPEASSFCFPLVSGTKAGCLTITAGA